MSRTARQLTALLPAILVALWSLLLLQTPGGPAEAAPAASHGRVATAPVPAPVAETPSPVRVVAPPEPHLAPVAVAQLPVAVEHSVRFPMPPAAPAAAVADLSVPSRGVFAGDARRERAPPGDRHEPRDPRGPPSPRHS
ncbi:hypothetical protein [Streptomyces sp. NBC_00094]|uniref:hypothetical protein n=1 Tax=Streptomyces sp. NBC_00094 TaxID=2903620 RepID=UPI0022577E35|nr:hypothetical protein [Streptomyces sp. NBC_00094]MCX5388639.1 hypothetical protein [Streptomyces sp. NBC_00094]